MHIMEKERAILFTIILFSSFFLLNSLTNNNNNKFIIFAQGKNMSKQMMPMEQIAGIWESAIPPMTNWIGIFSLGMMSALLHF